MPTSVPGSRAAGRGARGFTLLELLVVLVIVALSTGLVALALRDRSAERLEEEAQRLSALFEIARAESRAAGTPVSWVVVATGARAGERAPTADAPAALPAEFSFVGLPSRLPMPTRWLYAGTRARIVAAGPAALVLGPEAIGPAQRLELELDQRRLALASDGLGPFRVVEAAAP